jgi:hypothetical protein
MELRLIAKKSLTRTSLLAQWPVFFLKRAGELAPGPFPFLPRVKKGTVQGAASVAKRSVLN